ncbi:hypothetical protein FBU30_005446 [Linnemannia zychae]|nr:hypothetical protein FBU30_005446 [Linnemannia zychae]
MALHGLDKLSPAIQTHNHRFFLRPSSVTIDEVVYQLESSLAEALELYPPMTGKITTDENNEIYIVTDKEHPNGTPFLVDLKDETPFTNDYEGLSPRTEAILDSTASILAVKVTQFSCGTVCVASSFNHQVADLRGFLDFLELWAQLDRSEPVDFSRIPDDWTHTPGRYFSDLIRNLDKNKKIPAPPPFVLHDKPNLESYGYLSIPSTVTYWKMTDAQVLQLKSDLSPLVASLWISSGDALSALFSGTIARARQSGNVPRLSGRSSIESGTECIAMAADGRDRAPKKDMSGRYFGNFNNLWSLSVPRDDLLSPTASASGRVALAIRTHLEQQLSPESIAKRIAFFDDPSNINQPGRITWSADIILTNWGRFDLKASTMAFRWGKLFLATSGGVTVYPPGYSLMTRDGDTGDMTVLLTVEKEGEAALLADPLLNKYATFLSKA